MKEYEVKNWMRDKIKEICHYSQMQVFATSYYQRNYFQQQIDEVEEGIYQMYLEGYRMPRDNEEIGVQHEDNRIFHQQEQKAQPKVFTLEELSNYDGANGKEAYVAVDGTVYDVTMEIGWAGGTHFGLYAGKDLTDYFMGCHRGILEVLQNVPKVGTLST